MEQIAIILFLIGTVLFIGFGIAAGNSYGDNKEFEDLKKWERVKVNIFSILCLLGALTILTACILGIIDAI
ncbi:hypothetical protein [Capnocytophaga canis]|uniref:hypothetical protein n=1 Tax=Capnocytophaga canis TaxID=1848903 RepID=UPI001BB3544B|nr:hypothetical protein [Capnocytophaga canis]